MSTEEKLLEKWRSLPLRKQQEVANFVEFLYRQNQLEPSSKPELSKKKRSEKLQQVRERIVASGLPLLSKEEIEQEKAERRGGYQGN
ncbi:MAG: hypothetical protein SAJ12_22435 [Jaaginema sp. PMC 1079.18]|nr:hypothetical protein [Jaaginema sp. PMC 1080.18]MEC4853747.1 hypothetical protein [Jaaginema sp. PMC 1079.18]MEC4868887.1 hypothetical protein [Jaaginema sp. PMC 1078.18]